MFILLTDSKGLDVMINVNCISCARRVGDKTIIVDHDGDNMTVDENPREIYNLIQEEKSKPC